MTAVIFALPGNKQLGRALADMLGVEVGQFELRRFADGESYVRIDTSVETRRVVIVCTLRAFANRPGRRRPQQPTVPNLGCSSLKGLGTTPTLTVDRRAPSKISTKVTMLANLSDIQ